MKIYKLYKNNDYNVHFSIPWMNQILKNPKDLLDVDERLLINRDVYETLEETASSIEIDYNEGYLHRTITEMITID